MVVPEWHLALCLISGERVHLYEWEEEEECQNRIQLKARTENERMVEVGGGGKNKKKRAGAINQFHSERKCGNWDWEFIPELYSTLNPTWTSGSIVPPVLICTFSSQFFWPNQLFLRLMETVTSIYAIFFHNQTCFLNRIFKKNEINDWIMLLFELKEFAIIDKKKEESATTFIIP